jgi:hypothetical protein
MNIPALFFLKYDRFESLMAQIAHDLQAHGRIVFNHFGPDLSFFACGVCGKGSGVVFSNEDEFCAHIFDHYLGRPVRYPPGSIVPGN